MTSTLHLTRQHRASLAAVAIRLLHGLPHLTIRQAGDMVGLYPETIYRHWSKRHPGRQLRKERRAVTAKMAAAAIEPFAEFCDVMCEALTGDMTSAEWFAATEAQWGRIGKRQLYRGIKRLVDTRRVTRSGDVFRMPTYARCK